MEVYQVAKEIEKRIIRLGEGRRAISKRAQDKATAIAEYDKALGLAIVRLKAGEEVEFEGHKVKDPPVTIIEKIAKGICWKERLELESATALYKAAISRIESLQVELNGYQSINRHLSAL